MQTEASVLMSSPGEWTHISVDLDEPAAGEVLVEMVASGMCQSDDHYATGVMPNDNLPFCGGHEGSGIVRAVGPDVTGLRLGDHVVTSFIPACGDCTWCAAGKQHLCDDGAIIANSTLPDGSLRMNFESQGVYVDCAVGTFARHQVIGERSLVRVPNDLPLDVLSLLGCAVPTGWGSAVNAGRVGPGDVVIVMGCGGIGSNALQGAAAAGAARVIAVDPHDVAREMSSVFGATDSFGSIEEAANFARSLTDGQGADSVIVCTDVRTGEQVGQAVDAVAKDGTVVLTALGAQADNDLMRVAMNEFSLFAKRIQGALYGNGSPRSQIPRLIQLYREGRLKLDELVTTRYSIEQVQVGYEDLRAGRNIRGIIDFRL